MKLHRPTLFAALLSLSPARAAHEGNLLADSVSSGSASDQVLFLRSPEVSTVQIRTSSFRMGASLEEIQLAQAMCKLDGFVDACRPETFVDEHPAHNVLVSAYRLDRREVTVAEYERCVVSGNCNPRPVAAGGLRFNTPDWPATLVTWNDATTFCAWRGGRLPTEAEWERAARGIKGRRYPWGYVFNPFVLNGGRTNLSDPYEERDRFRELAPVGSFHRGRTTEGITDLAGNAEEWVYDYFAEYPTVDQVDPRGPSVGERRVVRGGSFLAGRAFTRATARSGAPPSLRDIHRGFRCAYDP